MSKDRNQDQDNDPPRRSRRAPQLDETDMNAVKSLLAEKSSRRKTVAAGLLRVIVDGSERARFDLNRSSHVRFETDENDELIEVRSADGLLLATYLLDQDDLPEMGRPERSSIVLESGQRLSFVLVKDGAGEMAGRKIDLSYHETRLSRAMAIHLRRLSFAAGDRWRNPGSVSWRPALTLATLAVIVLGLMLYWRGGRALQDYIANWRKPAPSPTVTPERVEKPDQRAPEPQPGSGAPNRAPKAPSRPRAPQSNKPESQPDDTVVAEVEREVDPGFENVALLAVKKVHVDSFGADSLSQQLRDQLTAALRTNRRLTLTASRNDADAVFKGKVTQTRAEQVSATVRLVNASGQVVWPVGGRITGKQYQGSINSVAGQIAKDLLDDMNKAERK